MKTHTLLLTSLLLSSASAALSQVTTPPASAATTETTADTIPSINLDDLEVVATRPVVQSDGAKLTYNMDEDISVKGQTLSDALRKVPMVSVDGEGNIKINGQDNFKIYVNGKEDPALTSQYKNIFKAMPADAVLKVEVITEPGAKYDAEGTAGILNLVTITKNSTDGYSGSINVGFSKSQAGVSLYGRMKHGKLSMSANLNYADAHLFYQSNWNENNIENSSPDFRYQYNKLQQKVVWDYLGGGLNVSYDLSEKDLLTANVNFTNMDADLLKGGYSIFKVWDTDHRLVGSARRDLKGELTNTTLNAGTAWQHSFNSEGDKLILSYLFNHGYDYLGASLIESESEGVQVVSPYEYTSNKGNTNEHTVQLDYMKAFAEGKHSLDAGGKVVLRRNPAIAYTLWQQGLTEEDAAPSDRSDIVQKQDIYSAYLSYSGRFGHLSATAGLRYEHTRMGIDFKEGLEPDFTNHLNDLVPNAALSYNFTEASALRLAYQMRISRPSLKQVNPYEFIYIPTIIEKGNPDLSSERANKITLTYSNFGRTFGGNIGFELSSIGNAISQFTYNVDDITYSTYANIGHNRSFAVFGLFNWSPLQNLQLSANARLTRQMLSSKSPDLSNAGWNVNYGANANYTLPDRFRLSLYGGQSTRNYNLQGWQDGWYYYGIALSKGFLKNEALTLTLSANQFLQSKMSFTAYVNTENMINRFTFYNRNWNVGISLSWNFGSLKSDVKKTSRRIENDDKSSVSGQSIM